jgi:hypothetical protein
MTVHLRGAPAGSSRENRSTEEHHRSDPGDPGDGQETTGSLPVAAVLDRLRQAAAAHDGDLPTSLPLRR